MRENNHAGTNLTSIEESWEQWPPWWPNTPRTTNASPSMPCGWRGVHQIRRLDERYTDHKTTLVRHMDDHRVWPGPDPRNTRAHIKGVAHAGNWFGYGIIEVDFRTDIDERRKTLLYLKKDGEFIEVVNTTITK